MALIIPIIFAAGVGIRALIVWGHVGEIDGLEMEVDEYFGSCAKSVFTMLQMLTLDRWSDHVVRPIIFKRPFEGCTLIVFTIVAAYGLKSVALGIMVESTVSFIRETKTTKQRILMVDDMENFNLLRTFLNASLKMSGRTFVDQRELKDAMCIPRVAEAFRSLGLPVQSVEELLEHIDTKQRGHVSVDELLTGMELMKQPATRLDSAKLTATVGGNQAFAANLSDRGEKLVQRIGALRHNLQMAFDKLEMLTDTDNPLGKDPQLMLRRAGRIYTHKLERKPRYSC